MLAFDARSVLLAIVCGLSAQWLSSPLASAAVIARNPQSSSSSSLQHPFPMSKAKHRSSKHTTHPHTMLKPKNRRMHKVRAPETNPFQIFLNAALSRLQRNSHRKRSSKAIVIPNNHGTNYQVVSHSRRGATTPQWIADPGSNHSASNSSSSNTTTTAQSTDDDDYPKMGTVQIMSHMDNATDKPIASLFCRNDTQVLDASEKNATVFYLNKVPPPSTRQPVASGHESDMLVYLSIPGLEHSRDYCATYDSNPSQAEPMFMTPCANYANTSDSPPTHDSTSQIFLYNLAYGQLHPMRSKGQDDGTMNVTSAQLPDNADDSLSSSSTNTVTATSATPSSSSINSRDDSSSQNSNVQNVTLIFVQTRKAAASDISESDNSTYSSSTLMTTTMTQTVTVYASKSTSSSSYSRFAPSASATGLNVEVVGGNPTVPSSSMSGQPSSTSVSASGMSMMDAPPSSTSTTPTPPSSSIDAAAIASSIAASVSSSMAASSTSTSVSVSGSTTSSASNSASTSASAAVADISPSSSSSPSSTASNSSSIQASSTSTSSPSSDTFIAAVMQRAKMLGRAADPDMTPVSTDPYKWKFQRDQ